MAAAEERKESLVRELFFPTPIYYADLSDGAALNAALLPRIYAWRAADPQGIVRSNPRQIGSWHSRPDMHERPEYGELVARIRNAARAVFADQGYDPAAPPGVVNMWANINPRHGFNRRHTHANVLWSGVYYVQAQPETGQLIFTDPRAAALMLTARYGPDRPRKPETWDEIRYQPIAGRLLLFPAWLPHEVEPNLAAGEGPEADRISVSFNLLQIIDPTGGAR